MRSCRTKALIAQLKFLNNFRFPCTAIKFSFVQKLFVKFERKIEVQKFEVLDVQPIKKG